MKRRQFIRCTQGGMLAAVGSSLASAWWPSQAQSGSSLSVQWLGHSCFLFTGDGQRLLVNPFKPVGCTAGYREANAVVDIVLISSRLLDEGIVEVLPVQPEQVLFEPGFYQLDSLKVQGIRTDHDRRGGRQFGVNVAWRWTQGGLKILHLGGTAAPITIEQKILMGRPDILFLPVGGGPKTYGPAEAKQAVETLNPRLVVPTHYRTQAADPGACDIVGLEEFLNLMEAPVERLNQDTVTLKPADIMASASGPTVTVFAYPFST